ncbi:hypothetical protein GCM10007863_17660 [Dyella mobilis]|nr:hypothetical protein GCM10007863_17660 [Dyella mobilis]
MLPPAPVPDGDPVDEPEPLGLPLDGLAELELPANGERTEPEPPQAVNETNATAIRLERRVRLRTLPEDMLRMIITPRTHCVPPVVGARK